MHHYIAPKLAIEFEFPTYGSSRAHVCNVVHLKCIQNRVGHSIISFSLVIFSPLCSEIAPNLCHLVHYSKQIRPVLNLCHCLARFLPCLVNSTSITMPRRYKPSSYANLFSIPKFAQCREVFLHAGWGAFLSSLQGHDDSLLLWVGNPSYGLALRVLSCMHK
jgi:hypothetical protein